ncbi:RND family efflux transporter MFP subunit [Brucella pseudogrignonensis]|uniref:RND family efflux transporter MFP subunit n=2 Tax=Brucella pseudogrignonensis TaxID=419475 RepID=A0ABU1M3R6_9HYPH|nr:efflux RND transporter periplasmic adaptor subunit [Brucella pseudogrignonensis]MDR6430396.1 RND family efflux transporter MFP subunit [Brucella pseudogrignonensis]
MASETPPLMQIRKVRLRAIAMVLLTSSVVGGFGYVAYAEMSGTIPVAVVESTLVDYQPQLTLSGAIAARSLVNVSFRVNGQVVERLVEIGQHVDKGEVLARIDNAEQQANMRVAQASQDAARAQLVQAEASFKRQQALLGQGFTTRSQFDQTQQVLRTAQSTVSNAESQLSNARDELSYTELRAPVSGVVTARNVESGQVVQAAQTAFSIAEDGARDAIFDVQETLVNHAKIGMGVTLGLLSDEEVKTEGSIREISPVVDAQTGTVRVKVGISEVPEQMALGAIVTGTVHMDGREVFILPWSAVTSDAGNTAVWRIAKDTKLAALVPVQVLAFEKERVIVASGLNEGDLVVTKGAQMLRAGAQTEIIQGLEGAAAQ